MLCQTFVPIQMKQQETGLIDKSEKTEYSKEEKFRDRQFSTSPMMMAIDKIISFADLPYRLHTNPLISKPTPPPDPAHLL